jgi:hypothetical protein
MRIRKANSHKNRRVQDGELLTLKIILIILFLIGGILMIYKSAFTDWSVDPTKTKEIIKTDLGDEFLFKYEYSNFPDSQTTINILDKKNNKEIAYFIIEDKPYKADLKNLINTSKIRCYEAYNKLIYSVNNDNFDYVNIDQINENDPVENPSLVQICKILVNLNEWKWIEVCVQFLINSGDSDILGSVAINVNNEVNLVGE